MDVGDGCCGSGEPTCGSDIACFYGDDIIIGVLNACKSAQTHAKGC